MKLGKDEVMEILSSLGGWVASGAIWNRTAVACTKLEVERVLASLVADGEVQEIHGLLGLEYALAGVDLPPEHSKGAPPRQLQAHGYTPAEKKPGAATSAPQLAPPPTPPPAQRKAPTQILTREQAKEAILQLLAAGIPYSLKEIAKLLNAHGGAVLGAVIELRSDNKVERTGAGSGSKYRLKPEGAAPNWTPPRREVAAAPTPPIPAPIPEAPQPPPVATAAPTADGRTSVEIELDDQLQQLRRRAAPIERLDEKQAVLQKLAAHFTGSVGALLVDIGNDLNRTAA